MSALQSTPVRASGRRRPRVPLWVLAGLVTIALLADLIASDAPIFLRRANATYVLPGVTRATPLAGRTSREIQSELVAGDFALWPVVRYGPRTLTDRPPLDSPSRAHPLGTDAFGRDVLAGLVHGARTSLAMAAVVGAVAVLLGSIVGGAAAALGGIWDALAERLVEVVCVFPVVVVVALVRALDRRSSLWSLLAILVAVKSAEIVRLTRVLVLRCLAEEWALAARASGATSLRVLRVQVWPHLVVPLAEAGALAAASVVITETVLAFLELGAPMALVSWGDMLAQVRWGAGPRVALPPMVALGLTIGALQWLARGFRQSREV